MGHGTDVTAGALSTWVLTGKVISQSPTTPFTDLHLTSIWYSNPWINHKSRVFCHKTKQWRGPTPLIRKFVSLNGDNCNCQGADRSAKELNPGELSEIT